MADTGWQLPGTVDGTWAGGNDWATPDNVKLDDENFARWTGSKFDGDQVDDGPSLKATNFGFSVPAGATITGVECQIQGYTDGNQVSDLVYLTELGSPLNLGTAKRLDWTTLTGTETTYTYGSSSDLWSATLTSTTVNQTDFGWIFMIYDDVAPLSSTIMYMKMKVHYELSSAAPIVMMIGA